MLDNEIKFYGYSSLQLWTQNNAKWILEHHCVCICEYILPVQLLQPYQSAHLGTGRRKAILSQRVVTTLYNKWTR